LSRLRRLNACGFRFRFSNNKKNRKISKPREIRVKSAAIAKILSLEKIPAKESIKRGHKNPKPNPKFYINKRKQQQRIFTQYKLYNSIRILKQKLPYFKKVLKPQCLRKAKVTTPKEDSKESKLIGFIFGNGLILFDIKRFWRGLLVCTIR